MLTELAGMAGGVLLLPFFSTAEARELALISQHFRVLAKSFPWHDPATPVCNLVRWRACFPRATACLVSPRADMGAVWEALELVRDIRWISFRECIGLQLASDRLELFAGTESLFVADGQVAGDTDPRMLRRVRDLAIWCDLGDEHLAGATELRTLDVFGNLRITDAGLQPLSQLHTLVLNGATMEYDDRVLARFDAQMNVHMQDDDDDENEIENEIENDSIVECAHITDAALVGKPLEYLYAIAIAGSFSGAALATLPLRQLCLRSCPRIKIRTGDLAPLTRLDFLCVIDCPSITVGDADICQMAELAQITLINCATRVTGAGLLRLVHLQMERQTDMQMQQKVQMHRCDIRGCPDALITGSDYAELSEYVDQIDFDSVFDDGPD
jgi:hypothetical protein